MHVCSFNFIAAIRRDLEDRLTRIVTVDNFLYFLNVKEALAGRTLTDSTFGAEWGRTAKTVSKDDHANAFSKWLDRCKNVC